MGEQNRWWTRVGYLGVGVGLGAGAVLALPSEADVAAPAPEVREPVDVEAQPRKLPAPTPQAATGEARCEDLQRQVAALKVRNAFMSGQLAQLGGARADWPPDVDETFEEASIRDWLADVLMEVEVGELETLDCNEYPCVALFRFPEGAAADSVQLDPLREALVSYGGSPHGPQSVWGTAAAPTEASRSLRKSRIPWCRSASRSG